MFIPILLAVASITIHTNFEAGNLGKVEQVAAAHFRCAVQGEADQDKHNRQASWYYFRLDGGRGKQVTIDLVDLVGEYNYKAGTHPVSGKTRPVYSEDHKTWKHFSDENVEWDERAMSLRLRFTPRADRIWIAHVPPYTNRDLQRLLAEFPRSPWLKREVVGKTVGGRDMLLLTVTNPKVAEEKKRVIWLMARQHAWESPTSWVAEGALRFLLLSDAAVARIRDTAIFKIFPMADPDGAARGGVRFNANGYDLNRNWDAVDPKLMPEIAAQRKAIFDWLDSNRRIDFFLTLHNTESGEFIEGPLRANPEIGTRIGRLFKILSETTTFAPTAQPRDAAVSTTPGKPGRMSVNQALFHDRGIAAMLMEQMVEYNRKLGRLPTVADRLEFGAGLARALWHAAAGGE
jgi:hypothetical protein